MKKFFLRLQDFQSGASFPWIVILSAFFLCGAVAGCISANYVDETSGSALNEYIGNYMSSSSAGSQTGSIVGYAFLNAFKYHGAVFLCGFSALGILFIPIIVAARGFFLSFAVTVFVRLFGYNGLLFSAGVFGITCLISLPFLLYVSAQAFLASVSLAGTSFGIGKARAHPVFGSGYFLVFCTCAAALTVCALFEAFVSPQIAGTLSGLLRLK